MAISSESNGHELHKVGRPTVRTEENAAKICELVAKGVPAKWAALQSGVSEETLYDWQAAEPQFRERIKQARAAKVERLVGRVNRDAETNWVAAMTLLERTEPEDFGRTNKVRHSHDGTVNIDVRPMMANPESIDLIASLERTYEVDEVDGHEVDGTLSLQDPLQDSTSTHLQLPPHKKE